MINATDKLEIIRAKEFSIRKENNNMNDKCYSCFHLRKDHKYFLGQKQSQGNHRCYKCAECKDFTEYSLFQ